MGTKALGLVVAVAGAALGIYAEQAGWAEVGRLGNAVGFDEGPYDPLIGFIAVLGFIFVFARERAAHQ